MSVCHLYVVLQRNVKICHVVKLACIFKRSQFFWCSPNHLPSRPASPWVWSSNCLSVKCTGWGIKIYGWGIKISHISRGHCAGCSRGREMGVVPCGWLASTVFSTLNGLDRWTSGLCCWSILWEQPFCDSDSAFRTRFTLGRNAHVTFSFGDT
jgi:hypothetical protein